MMKMFSHAVFISLVAAVVVAGTQPQQIIVVHRHGARTPIVNVNTSGVCPPCGCGVLNHAGKEMLYQLGVYLRQQYNSTLQPYSYYDFRTHRSMSTDVGRTLQSADAMLRGLFAHLEGTSERVLPVISTKPVDEAARLLVWTGWPSIVVWSVINTATFYELLSNKTLTLFDVATLGQIGAAQGLSEECEPGKPNYSPFGCALDAQDVMNCARSSGAPIPDIVAQNIPKLDQVLSWYNSYSMWGFDDGMNGGRFVEVMGTYGYVLAKDIIAKAKAGSSVLEHYSGHDTTLMPLWMTLGNLSLINPAFAEAMLFEVYNVTDNTSKTSNLVIVAKIGQPGQRPGNHNYNFEPYQMYCIDVGTNTTYQSSTCPLADFEAYIDTRGPSTPQGICYAPTEWLPLFDCAPNSTNYLSNANCVTYRSHCLSACGSGYAMAPNLSCVPL